jgi:hypothetical protein
MASDIMFVKALTDSTGARLVLSKYKLACLWVLV